MTKPKFFFLTTFLIFSTSLFAQNNYREIGMSLSDNFTMGFVYKKQKAENRFINFQSSFANVSVNSFSGATGTNIDLGFSFTLEKRENLAEKLQFLHGWSPGFRLRHNRIDADSDGVSVTNFTPIISYRLGFLYNCSESFYIALQGAISSSVTFAVGGDTEGISTVFNLGFSQNAVSLNLVYRFRKKA